MRRLGLQFWALGSAAFAIAPAEASPANCAALLDSASRTELSLPAHRFDQDEAAGWRALDAQGCAAEAAQLVERYLIGYESNLRSLKWHHAQLLATTGEYPAAIASARQAINPVEDSQHPNFKWNAYILATIAFLEGHHEELERQTKVIATAVGFEPVNQVNLDVALRLQRCRGQPYKVAYSCSVVVERDRLK